MATSGRRLRLGEILIKAGILTEDQLGHALAQQQHTRAPIGEILIQLGYVSEEQIKHALELQYGVKSYTAKNRVPHELIRLIPENMIKQHQILPVAISQMTVAMVDPGNILALDDLRLRFKGVSIQPVVITEAEFRECVKSLPREMLVAAAEAPPEEERPAEGGHVEEQTASQLALTLLATALRRKATEIILEPQEFETWVRMRPHGGLVKDTSLPNRVAAAVIARFKVMADLNLTAGSVSQLGTIKTHHEGRAINLVLRTLPVKYGQLLTLRLFDHAAVEHVTLDTLIQHPAAVTALRRMLVARTGLILVQGPKQSGKATLVHALLKEALKAHQSVVTFGQLPFDLDGVNQVPVDVQKPESTLAQIFEQGPDLLAMPSLSDSELARKLIHGALSGGSAVVEMPTSQRFLDQLLDLSELPVRAVANAVAGVITTRLVRKLCAKCKVPYKPDEQTAAFFRPLNETGMLYRAVGCPECADTGYAGMVGIYGVLPFDAQVRHFIASHAASPAIDAYAKQQGYVTPHDYATWVAAEGLSTLEELGKTDLFERITVSN